MLRLLLRQQNVARCQLLVRPFASEKKDIESVTKTAGSIPDEPEPQSIHRRMHQPTDFEKKMLVWVGRYKTIEEIPRSVPVETIDRARNKGRIKICNYMILATIMGCIFMAWSGKQAAQRGESVHKMNVDWHQAIKEGKA